MLPSRGCAKELGSKAEMFDKTQEAPERTYGGGVRKGCTQATIFMLKRIKYKTIKKNI